MVNRKNKQQTRILLVDDHDLVRAGTRLLIGELDESAQILEASSGEQSIEIVEAGKVDIVFMDIALPGMDGIVAALRLLQIDPQLKIIMLTGNNSGLIPRVLEQSGVCGYLTKYAAHEEIKSAIDAANNGGFYVSSDLLDPVLVESGNDSADINPFDRLSQREWQVVLLLLQGYKTGDAGKSLVLNAKTVSTYKRRAFEKLGVENTADLVKLAIEFGVLAKG